MMMNGGPAAGCMHGDSVDSSTWSILRHARLSSGINASIVHPVLKIKHFDIGDTYVK